MPNRQETYLFGQGKVEVAELTDTGPGPFEWLGDISSLDLAFEEEKFAHNESYTGQRSVVREISVGTSMTVSMTMHELNAAAHGPLYTRAKRTSIAAARFTDGKLGHSRYRMWFN